VAQRRKGGDGVTAKAAFSNEEWESLLEGPAGAAMLVITAQPGGTVRETFSMAKAYAEARSEPGRSELLDEIVSARPRVPNGRQQTPDEFRAGVLSQLEETAALLHARTSGPELDEYRQFVLTVAESVARAHREGTTSEDHVSDAERAAIVAIAHALGRTSEASA
jgi:hypothetical protein